MTDEAEAANEVSAELEQMATWRARQRAKAAMWNLDIAIFLFALLIILIILLFQEIGIEIVAPIAIFGLAMVWLVGWRRGRQLYRHFYDDELSKLRLESEKPAKETEEEETIEEMVQRVLRGK